DLRVREIGNGVEGDVLHRIQPRERRHPDEEKDDEFVARAEFDNFVDHRFTPVSPAVDAANDLQPWALPAAPASSDAANDLQASLAATADRPVDVANGRPAVSAGLLSASLSSRLPRRRRRDSCRACPSRPPPTSACFRNRPGSWLKS